MLSKILYDRLKESQKTCHRAILRTDWGNCNDMRCNRPRGLHLRGIPGDPLKPLNYKSSILPRNLRGSSIESGPYKAFRHAEGFFQGFFLLYKLHYWLYNNNKPWMNK